MKQKATTILEKNLLKSAEKLMTEVCQTMGINLEDRSTEDTPKRFIEYLAEYNQHLDIDEVLGKPFDSPEAAMVIQSQIPFRMICEHHLLPALGFAAVGYIPNGKVCGLSKLARLVDAVGVEKPSLQEHINHRIADLLDKNLKPKGVMVVIEAEHGCMACRGINKPNVITTSSVVKGVFFTEPTARTEFLALARTKR